MLAVIRTGGKQYLVSPGDTIKIEKLEGEAGKKIEFSDVLLVNDEKQTAIGTPYVEGAKAIGEIIDQIKGEKIIAFKYRPKDRYRRKVGHRQKYTKVKIENIVTPK
jgi:large subunit ribosomal protein L21